MISLKSNFLIKNIIFFLLGTFFFVLYFIAYKNRTRVAALFISFSIFIMLIMSVKNTGSYFNQYTVSVDLCETMQAANKMDSIKVLERPIHSLNHLITCLPKHEKKMFKK